MISSSSLADSRSCLFSNTDVIIYDYVDDGVPVLARMHQKRLAGCRAMGYTAADEARG